MSLPKLVLPKQQQNSNIEIEGNNGLQEDGEQDRLITNSTSVDIELSVAQIQSVINSFAEKQTPSIKSLLNQIVPKLIDNTITLPIVKQQLVLLNDAHLELQRAIKKHFNIPNLVIEIEELIEPEREAKAYTPKEILTEMIRDNEGVKKLVERLKLNIKY